MSKELSGMTRFTRYRLLVILLVFVVISGLYSVITPLFEGPDEIWHFAFANHLANGGGLPVFDVNAPVTLLRNGAHPPLYYVLLAALIAPIDRSDFPAEFHFNLANPLITKGASGTSRNLLIHTAREDWPWQTTALAAHLARLVSIALGVVTVLGVWLVARQVLTDERLALLVMALVAVVPQFVYGAALINNDALAAAATTWLIYALIRLKNALKLKWAAISGGVLGIALLSKIGLVVLLPVPALALVFYAVDRTHPAARNWQRLIRVAVVVYGLAFIIAGWWYIRNWQLYGDPLAWREWQALTGAGRVPPTPLDFLHDMLGLFGTFWIDFSLRLDRTWWPVFGVIVSVALIGLGRRALKRQWPSLDWSGLLIGLSVFALLLASAVRYSFNIYDIHGRLLYPSLAAIGVVLVLGLSAWPRSKWITFAVVGLIGLVTLVAPFVIIQPAYARPIVSALPDGVTPTSARFDNAELIGYAVRPDQMMTGDTASITTYWRMLQPAVNQTTLRAVVALTGLNSGEVVGRAESVLGTDAYPSWAWQPGEIVATETRLSAQTTASTVADVRLGLRGETAQLIPSGAGDTIELGRIVVRVAQPCSSHTTTNVAFGESIRLIGYRLDSDRLVLCWQSIKSVPIDYTVFVHVTDNAAQVLSADGPPRNAAYPTSAWTVGEQVEDRHTLPIESGAIRQLTIGLYRPDTGERLTIDGTNSTEYELIK